jgi:hypothetical protein
MWMWMWMWLWSLWWMRRVARCEMCALEGTNPDHQNQNPPLNKTGSTRAFLTFKPDWRLDIYEL